MLKKNFFIYLPFMVLVLFKSYVFCFVHDRVLDLGRVIMSNKTKLRTKLMIRDDKL